MKSVWWKTQKEQDAFEKLVVQCSKAKTKEEVTVARLALTEYKKMCLMNTCYLALGTFLFVSSVGIAVLVLLEICTITY